MGFFTFTPSRGSNNGHISVSIEANGTDASRQGQIIVSNAEHGITRTVIVNQSAAPIEPCRQIFYTTYFGDIAVPANTTGWTNADGERVTIINDTYIEGVGCITFNDCIANVPHNAFHGENCSSACSHLTSIVIPDSVVEIGYDAFRCNSYLSAVTLGNNVEIIDSGAFYNCPISAIVIPDSVTRIGVEAFAFCNYLTAIDLPEGVTNISDYMFCQCNALSSVTIGTNVTNIGDYAFYACYHLSAIDIPYGVTNIGSHAIDGCYALTSIVIPDSVTSIGDYAFAFDHALTSIVIPDNVTSINECTFKGCNNLSSVTLGNSVAHIVEDAFSGCTSLTEIYSYNPTQPEADLGAFYPISSTGILHYPQGSNYDTFKTHLPSGWTAIADL